ncbi:MAG: tetratricopeptide repeat protein [Bacteroides sp.]|jgi:tetratricopeptide (TPR) repeat protein|nr:tetratricopeptide repeat protein [Bacteroides sp.]
MLYKNIIKEYQNIVSMLHKRQVVEAIEKLRLLVKESQKEFINERLDNLLETYRNILKHSFAAVHDPEREKIYHYLIRSLLELADELKEMLLTEAGASNTYQMKSRLQREQRLERQEALAYLERVTYDDQLAGLLKEVKVADSNDLPGREESLIRIFNIIWLTDKYTEAEIELLNASCDSGRLPWHDKGLIVSALTLSLLRYFDVNKFLILFRFAEKREERVWERAMVGLFVAFLKYNDRFYLYPVLEEKTLDFREFPGIEQNLEAIVIQFTKAKETEKVRRKWEEEIMPAMMKMRPKIEEKLELDQIFKEEFGEEKNPDWETVFEDTPGLLDKLQEFTEMQLEGMDVFMSAFSQLKGFPFFREISNWFVPFYMENEAIASSLGSGTGQTDLTPLVSKLEDSFFMCNSDKYSFCLNLGMAPEQQKAMMMNMLNNELGNYAEIEQDESLLNDFARTKSIYTQYFQDLYRFFKIHPWRQEFDDIFSLDVDLYETAFVKHLVSESKTIRNIAELFFDKKFYPDALKVFLAILENEKDNIELFEKIAFCYEKTGQLDKAYDYYVRADLIDSDRPWIMRKLAFCSKYLNRWEEALRYYRQVEKAEPDDLKVQANIGQCLVHLERYEEALDYYFKIEVLAPENHRIRRPLAWCSFLTGKLDTAKDYLERLLNADPENPYDLENLGHVLWCQGQPAEALKSYRQSLARMKDFDTFKASFNEDRKHLEGFGISPFDMDLMLDAVKMGE